MSSGDLYCIKTHSQKVVLRGNIYPLLGVDGKACGCKDVVDVGIRGSIPNDIPMGSMVRCNCCNKLYAFDGVWWVSKKLFINLDDINIDELIEETITADV